MQETKVSAELNKVLGGVRPVAGSAVGQALTYAMTGDAGQAGAPSTASTGTTSGQGALSDALTQNTSQLLQVHSALQGQLDSLVANTQAVTQNTTEKSTGSAVAGAAGNFAQSIFGGGLLGSLVSGLTSLFGGGGDSQAPTPLVKFAMPPKVEYQGGMQGQATGNVDYGANGQPRPAGAAQASANVTVNVSAMDSRSFLDHSSDIASAVRRAMLESSSLNDVIGEM